MSENPIAATGSEDTATPAQVEPGMSVFGRFVSTSTIGLMATSAITVMIDQATKAIARAQLIQGQPVAVIPKYFDLSLSFNSGAAFGIMPNATPLLVIIGFVLIFSIVRLRGIGKKAPGLRLGLGLLLGGAVGNLIDRVMPSHMVTDFISLHLSIEGIQHSWPNFNLADVAIVIGVIVVILGVHRVERDDPQQ
jgi:signal peptidase II